MRRVGCNCGVDVKPGIVVTPSQEQLDNTWSTQGYYPGTACRIPDDCKHITSYVELKNHPLINGVELIGNRTSADLGLQSTMAAIPNTQIQSMFDQL